MQSSNIVKKETFNLDSKKKQKSKLHGEIQQTKEEKVSRLTLVECISKNSE